MLQEDAPKKKKVTKEVAKVTRWEEKLFNALKDPNESSGNEREIEGHMNYYYQRMDTQDLITAGTVSDIAEGYQLLADLGLRGVFSVYCAKGKDFDQFAFKNEMKELGFNKFFAHKLFIQLELWRKALPKDITEEEMQGSWMSKRRIPDSVVYLQ